MANEPEITGRLSIDTGGFLSLIRSALSSATKEVANFVRGAGRISLSATADTSAASGQLNKLRDDATKAGAAADAAISGIVADIDLGDAEQEFDDLVDKAKQSAQRANDELANVGKGGGLAKFGAIAGAAVGIGAIAKEAIGANAEMETFQVQIATLIKGTADFKEKYKGITDPLELQAKAAEEAKVRMAELVKFGAETPFELPGIAKAEKVLLGFGLTGQKAIQLTGKSATELRTVIGDVAAGTGVSFDELSVTVGKFSAGASGEAIARLQELGIVTKEELKKAGIEFDKAGSLTSPIDKALTATIKIAQDKFGGGMKQLSGTFDGQLSTLADNTKQTLAQLGAPLFEVAKTGLGKLLEIFSTEEFSKAIGQVGAVLGAVVAPISDIFGKLLTPFLQLLGPLAGLASSVLLPIGKALSDIAGVLAGVLSQALGPIGALLSAIGSLLGSVLSPILGSLVKLLEPILKVVGSLVAVVASLLSAFVPLIQIALEPLVAILSVAIDVVTAFVEPVADVIAEVAKLVVLIVNELRPIFDELIPLISDAAKLFAAALAQGIRAVVDIAKGLVQRLGEMLAGLTGSKNGAEAFAKVLALVKTVVTAVVGVIKNLRAELAGVAGVFQFTVAAVKQFIEGLLDFDVDKISGSFENFFAGAKAAYEKGKRDFLGSPFSVQPTVTLDFAEPTTPPPPKPDPGAGGAGGKSDAQKEAERIADLLAKIQRQIDQTRDATERRQLDERQAELAALRQTGVDRLAEIRSQADKEKSERVKLKIAELAEVTATANAAAESDKTTALIDKGFKALTAAIDTDYKDLTARIREKEEGISAETATGIQARGDLRRQALTAALENEVRQIASRAPDVRAAFNELDRAFLDQKIDADIYAKQVRALLDRGIPEIQAIQDQIADAGRQALDGTIRTDDYERRIRQILDAARVALADQPATLAALTKSAIDQQKQLFDERSALRTLAARDEEERIAAITDADKRAAAEQSLAARRSYNERVDDLDRLESRVKELRQLGEIDEQDLNDRLAAIAKSRINAELELERRLYETRRDYLAKTNVAVGLAVQFEQSLRDQARKHQTDAERAESDRRRKELDGQIQDLRESLARGSVSLRDYNKQFARLADERAKIVQDSGDAITVALRALQLGVTRSLSRIADQYTGALDKSVGELVDGTGKFGDVIENASVALGAIVLQSAVAGENTAKSFAKRSLEILLTVLESQAKAIVALIIGKEFAEKGFLGLATSAVLTGVFLAAVAAGRAALDNAEFRRAGGPMLGGLITGRRQLYVVNEEGEEFAINARATARHRQLLEWINAGRDPAELILARALAEPRGLGLALDPAGRIVAQTPAGDGSADQLATISAYLRDIELTLAAQRRAIRQIEKSTATSAAVAVAQDRPANPLFTV